MSITQKRHKNSKLVYLKRFPIVIHESNKALQDDYFSFASRGIGSFFAKDSTRPGTGLTISEENLLMPHVLNIPADDKDFRQKVTDYYHSINTKVKPGEGTALEIGLEYGLDREISEDGITLSNPPLNIGQYLMYKHAILHPEVAESEEIGKGNQLKAYYIFDPEKVTGKNVNISNSKDEAFEAYLAVKKNPNKVDMYLTLLGSYSTNMSPNDKMLKLRDLAEKKTKEFLAVHADKDKDIAYFINAAVENGILQKVGTRILIKESGEEIGRDKTQTILWLKDVKNSKHFITFKAQLKDKTHFPEEEDEPEA